MSEYSREGLTDLAVHIGTYMLGAWGESVAGVRGDDWEQDAAREAADQWLSDPDAHAALAASLPHDVMLAELVKRGELREDRRTLNDGYAISVRNSDGTGFDGGRPSTRQRRLVTAWQSLTSDESLALLRERLTGSDGEA